MHTDPHPLAGRTVTVTAAALTPGRAPHVTEAKLEDWWDRMVGESWMLENSPVTVQYGVRRRHVGLPVDDDVVYVKVDGQGQLAHASEITGAAGPHRDS